jgi:biotin carboxyl carrier protein
MTKQQKKNGTASAAAERQVTDRFVVEFRKYTTELNQKFLDRKPWEPKDESKVLSFIPGTITKIYVKEGDLVEEGTPLMILEAMKMKNTVFAERPGRVVKINVSEGERVPKSKVIFEFDLD